MFYINGWDLLDFILMLNVSWNIFSFYLIWLCATLSRCIIKNKIQHTEVHGKNIFQKFGGCEYFCELALLTMTSVDPPKMQMQKQNWGNGFISQPWRGWQLILGEQRKGHSISLCLESFLCVNMKIRNGFGCSGVLQTPQVSLSVENIKTQISLEKYRYSHNNLHISK